MAFQAVPRRLYPIRIYTSEQILEGQLEPLGHLFDDLNDSAKTGFLLHQAHIAPLVAGSSLRPFSLEQVTVNKTDFSSTLSGRCGRPREPEPDDSHRDGDCLHLAFCDSGAVPHGRRNPPP